MNSQSVCSRFAWRYSLSQYKRILACLARPELFSLSQFLLFEDLVHYQLRVLIQRGLTSFPIVAICVVPYVKRSKTMCPINHHRPVFMKFTGKSSTNSTITAMNWQFWSFSVTLIGFMVKVGFAHAETILMTIRPVTFT